MRLVRRLCQAGALALLVAAAAPGGTILVLPFENQTRNANLDWIGESLVESLAGRFAGPQSYVISRDERAAAFDSLGIPAAGIISHATIIKLAETTDADYVIIGSFTLTAADEFQASAEVMETRPMRFAARANESGPLPQLLDIQDRVAAALAQQLPGTALSPAPPRVRLEAWENYIRGLSVSARLQQIKYYREAARLEPGFSRVALQLGKIYFQNRDYPTAILWLSKLKKDESNYLEASFLLGICYFNQEEYEKAEAAFQAVAAQLPLNEVYNNLGAAQSRRNRRAALDNFRKAAEGDPSDPDYQFNAGYWYWKNARYTQAGRRLRLALARHPNDAEARALLLKCLEKSGNAADASRERELLAKNPAALRYATLDDNLFESSERLKRNYDEPSFRQLQLTLQTLNEEKLAALPRPQHAQVHLERGRDLFRGQNDAEALAELLEAEQLDPRPAETHLLLARLYERGGHGGEAVREAQLVLSAQNSVDAHMLLAKIYLEQNKLVDARQQAEQALQVEPGNVAARSVLQTIQMRTP
jgi:tetratricopeptide (TPR) repeat protein